MFSDCNFKAAPVILNILTLKAAQLMKRTGLHRRKDKKSVSLDVIVTV